MANRVAVIEDARPTELINTYANATKPANSQTKATEPETVNDTDASKTTSSREANNDDPISIHGINTPSISQQQSDHGSANGDILESDKNPDPDLNSNHNVDEPSKHSLFTPAVDVVAKDETTNSSTGSSEINQAPEDQLTESSNAGFADDSKLNSSGPETVYIYQWPFDLPQSPFKVPIERFTKSKDQSFAMVSLKTIKRVRNIAYRRKIIPTGFTMENPKGNPFWSKMESLLVQERGEIAPEECGPCSNPSRPGGPFQTCVRLPHYLQEACSNCHFNQNGKNCPFSCKFIQSHCIYNLLIFSATHIPPINKRKATASSGNQMIKQRKLEKVEAEVENVEVEVEEIEVEMGQNFESTLKKLSDEELTAKKEELSEKKNQVSQQLKACTQEMMARRGGS